MNNQVKSYKILAIVMPIVALIIATIFTMTQITRMRGLQADKAAVDKDIAFLEDLMQQDQLQPITNKIPAEVISQQEQAAFLNQLRQLAAASGVEIVQWTNTARSLATPEPKEGEDPSAASKVQALMCTMNIRGEYARIRSFMYSLLRSTRLLNVSNLTWTRTNEYPRQALTFTCTRYVTTEPTLLGTPPAQDPANPAEEPGVTSPATTDSSGATEVTARVEGATLGGS